MTEGQIDVLRDIRDNVIAVKLSDGVTLFTMDTTGALVAITTEHNRIHKGEFFTVSDIDDDVDTGAPKLWRLTTPNLATEMHVKTLRIGSTSGAHVVLEEGSTIGTIGTTITAFNNNRNSTLLPTMVLTGDPTGITPGTTIGHHLIEGGGRLFTTFGGNVQTAVEWELKLNENYIVKVIPDSDNSTISIVCQWYEHTD